MKKCLLVVLIGMVLAMDIYGVINEKLTEIERMNEEVKITTVTKVYVE